VKRLSELSLKIGDGTHSSVRFSENNEVPFLFVSCIRPNKIDWTKKTSINLDEYMKISRGKEPKKGTVLYSLVGSYGNAVTLDSAIKLSFQRHIGFIETKRNELVPDFLTLFLNSIYGNIQADDLAVGNAQKTITLGALNQFQILKPSFKEQKLIVEKNKFIQIHLTEIETQLSKLQSLKTGLMQDLLTGKVRVNSAEVKEANETGLV
jgi:type I restriction enzyme S subunit